MKKQLLFLIIISGIGSGPLVAEGPLPEYKSGEVAKHTSAKDCWLIIDNKVYDVTSYIPRHPAPIESILTYCGKEASKAFNTKGKARPHSPRATKLLSSYLVGAIVPEAEEVVAASPLEQGARPD